MSSRPWVAAALLSIVPGLAGAIGHTAGPEGCVVGDRAPRATLWNPPLDRLISMRENDAPLRSLVDRIALAAGFRISYASDALPLARRACAAFDSVTAGDALVDLLRGSSLEPAALASNYVVLRPRRVPVAREPSGNVELIVPHQLDAVVSATRQATSDPAGTLVPYSLPAVAGRLAWSRALDGGWDVPGSLASTVSSGDSWLGNASWLGRANRGASSFGLTYPKVYVDGIEVALPLLFAGAEPELIDRVEVIRGPAGAALLGSGGADGVINIVTRHDPPVDGKLALSVRTVAGLSERQAWGDGVMSQKHELSLRGGSGLTTASAAMSLRTTGDFVAGAAGRRTSGGASVRTIRSHAVLTLTGRWAADDASPGSFVARPPLRLNSSHDADGRIATAADGSASGSNDGPLSTRQYAFGATATYLPSGRFTHAATVGLDGYGLGGVAAPGILPAALDSAFLALRGSGQRLTVRAGSSARFGDDRAIGTVSVSMEHSSMRQLRSSTLAGAAGPVAASPRHLTSSTALTAVGAIALRDALFLEAGGRAERIERDGAPAMLLLPAVGAAYVVRAGDASIRLRSAFGKAAGALDSGPVSLETTVSRGARAPARPRMGSGVEGGLDFRLGRFSTRATYFRQVASAQVAAPPAHSIDPDAPHDRLDAGAISNSGWELQGSGAFGPLSISADLSLVRSRVLKLGEGHELTEGDRMLGVPSRNSSLAALWRGNGWTTSVSLSQAADWIGYDQIALGKALAGEAVLLRGGARRDYWLSYPGFTRLGGRYTRDLGSSLSVRLIGDNLLDRRSGEPDNATLIPGRTISVGLSVKR